MRPKADREEEEARCKRIAMLLSDGYVGSSLEKKMSTEDNMVAAEGDKTIPVAPNRQSSRSSSSRQIASRRRPVSNKTVRTNLQPEDKHDFSHTPIVVNPRATTPISIPNIDVCPPFVTEGETSIAGATLNDLPEKRIMVCDITFITEARPDRIKTLQAAQEISSSSNSFPASLSVFGNLISSIDHERYTFDTAATPASSQAQYAAGFDANNEITPSCSNSLERNNMAEDLASDFEREWGRIQEILSLEALFADDFLQYNGV